jgi:hypothetical protein
MKNHLKNHFCFEVDTEACTAMKIPFMYSFFGIGPHISLQQNRQADPGNMYLNLSQIYECRNWETVHYNSVLEITVSFLGIHK